MKKNLIELIEKIDEIESCFHVSSTGNLPSHKIIYDKTEFSIWKQEVQLELQDIFDRTNDQFIWGILTTLKQGFNGWQDEGTFNEVQGGLLAVLKNVDKYYPQNIEDKVLSLKIENKDLKRPKIFISHATQDRKYVAMLIELLENIGLTEKQVFCSSVAGYGIPLDEDIYDYLRQQFEEYNLHIILVLSDNYYKSVASMNEMGAAWVLQSRYTTILLPGFEFKEIVGAINPRKIGIKLDNDLDDVKEKLGQLKDMLIDEFDLKALKDVRWEQKRDSFIMNTLKIQPKQKISEGALKLLKEASATSDGIIIKFTDLEGVYIQVDNINFITSQDRRTIAMWENSLNELVEEGLVQAKNSKNDIFAVTQKGYDYIDDIEE